jgi:leucyl aminopeptidase
MDVKIVTDKYYEVVADALAVPVYEGETTGEGLLKDLDERTDGTVSSILERREFRGKPNELAYFHLVSGLKARRLLLVGLGKAEKFTQNRLRETAGTVARALKNKRVRAVAFVSRDKTEPETTAQALVEGLYLSLFETDTYKTKKEEETTILNEFLIVAETGSREAMERGAGFGKVVGESVNFSREMINEPSSHLTPKDMAERARQMAESVGLSVDILGESQMSQLGMGSLLGVSRGSAEEAQLIVLKYEHPDARDSETLALIGKGITFDSGGISIKPSEGMEKMKYDMAGAAAVMGAMRAIGVLKPKVRVVGVMACSENLPSGTAIKPGDVLLSMSGKTIEVINTDAEGRLVLADAITYAKQKLGAKKLIDIATLTGAVTIALGSIYAGLLGNDEEMIKELIDAGRRAGERLWHLPLDEEYGEQIKSEIADIKNTGGRPAGTITGAYFIKEFAGDTPWAHLDIASTAWNGEKKPYLSKGPTGMGVRTFVNWVLDQSK